MLGKNIGRKVGANFVNTEYQAFLTDKRKQKKEEQKSAEPVTTKDSAEKPGKSLLKRAEMRKKGIFVQADSVEMDPTVMEKTRSISRPFICRPRNRKLKWKHHIKKLLKIDTSASGSSSAETSEEEEKKSAKVSTEKVYKTQSSAEVKTPPITPTNTPVARREAAEKETKPLPEQKTVDDKGSSERIGLAKPPKLAEREKSFEEKDLPEPIKPSKPDKSVEDKELPEAIKPSKPDKSVEDKELPEVIKPSKPDKSVEEKELPEDIKPSKPDARVLEEVRTMEEKDSSFKKSRDRKKDDVFGTLEEDVDLTRVLVDFSAEKLVGISADDKRALDTAQKILKVAYKEKAFEKTLTKEENDVLAKFFSGKIPYDANVLNILDGVLDKTIEYFHTHKTNLDPETKALIEQREALKAAMLQTMLAKPSFIPTDWVKQYEAYHQEALKQTTGINWARVTLLYPRHRAFDDGAADIFGNFTRARRGHWIWGCIFGPTDSKSFEEVDREKKSQGFYMDTAIMEDAKHQNAEETPSLSAGQPTSASDVQGDKST